ncbi:Uncharacterised protein [Mycobacterium tuberculosis]|nr:Uncharacterised protein [Mycobacterium tuberculosis]CNU17510.1 Uncharacterised protein [Mycobacterium tuberculosis]
MGAVHLGPPQRLIGIDVADSRHHPLIQQLALEFGMLAPQHFNYSVTIEPRVKRVARQVGDRHRYHAAVHRHQVGKQPPSEGPLVSEAQHGPVVEQRGNPDVSGTRHRPEQHLPTHAQVHHECGVRRPMDPSRIECQPQVLAAPIGSVDPRSPQPRRQIRGPGIVAAHSAGVVHPNLGDGPAGHVSLQAAPHHLDFGQLGHPVMIASAAKPGAAGHHHRTSDDRKRGEAGRSPPQAGGAPRSSPSNQ